MKSIPKPHLRGIQILRGLAALLVVLHHTAEASSLPNLPRPLWNGAFGVDLFFPISGLVLYLTASRLRTTWQTFAWRRLLRIAPLYWLATTLKLILFLAIPSALLHFRPRWTNILASYLFLPALGPAGTPLPVLPVGWTLHYELAFYLLLTAALALHLPLIRTLTLALATISLIGLALPHAWGAWTWLFHPIQLEFLFGLALGAALPHLQRLPPWLPTLILPIALVFALDYPNPAVWAPTRVLFWGIPGALILLSTLALEPRIPHPRPLLLLGDASYSLYLTHTFILPAIALAARHLTLTPAAFFLAATLLSVLAGILVHLYLELPLLNALSNRPVPWSTRSAEDPLLS